MPLDHPPMVLEARVGEAVEFSLQATPGAGLRWVPPPAPTGCVLTDAGYAGPSGPGVGGPSAQRFQIRCDTAGTLRLSFAYQRPWETEVRARQLLVLTVR